MEVAVTVYYVVSVHKYCSQILDCSVTPALGVNFLCYVIEVNKLW
ncbi:hypothetical protein SLEP1_g57569 [Rubroshorea leprosula]|uniref:Uncharacterized protein n=1 Tax=Rubroshorea leprosula TaxID=152421 RepID=A0AAV5MPH6_9ROSI|nr:hypothetical protein SLEP1_g57569 [Rubroshorea leprosula]